MGGITRKKKDGMCQGRWKIYEGVTGLGEWKYGQRKRVMPYYMFQQGEQAANLTTTDSSHIKQYIKGGALCLVSTTLLHFSTTR